MNGWTLAEALEANFGAHRLIVNGTDIRGWYSRDAAERAAAWYRERGHAADVRGPGNVAA